MRHRLVTYFLSVIFGLCFVVGLCTEVMASDKENRLLGVVKKLKGEHEVLFVIKEKGKLHLQGSQKWQIELARHLGNTEFTLKDVLNTTESGGHIDNALTVAAAFKLTEAVEGMYAGTKVNRLTKDKERQIIYSSYCLIHIPLSSFMCQNDEWYIVVLLMSLKLQYRRYADLFFP
jgi:hypothetical protein